MGAKGGIHDQNTGSLSGCTAIALGSCRKPKPKRRIGARMFWRGAVQQSRSSRSVLLARPLSADVAQSDSPARPSLSTDNGGATADDHLYGRYWRNGLADHLSKPRAVLLASAGADPESLAAMPADQGGGLTAFSSHG